MEGLLIRINFTNKRRIRLIVAAVAMSLMVASAAHAASNDSKPKSGGGLLRITHESRYDDPFDGTSFPTIYKSGFDVCTNIGGQPVVFLFTSSYCSHCEWLGKIYDVIVKDYIEDGRIEAHHYDIHSKDDLLTEEIETDISDEIYELFTHGSPKELVPYINFSCKYERVGTGYEKTQDTEAEGQEIMDVIETLIKGLSTE